MIKVANKEERARARLRAALRCVRMLRRTVSRLRTTATAVDAYDGRYDYPDSDAQEHCAGCGVYSKQSVRGHAPGCLVVEAHAALRAFDRVAKR